MRKLIALFVSAPALAAFADCEMTRFQRVQPTPHVTVFEAAEGTTGVVNGNILAVVGKDAVLVVDTGQFPSVARRVIAEIRSITSAPVKYVVNTHWHGDHLLGNDVFKQAYPGVKFRPQPIEQGAKFTPTTRQSAKSQSSSTRWRSRAQVRRGEVWIRKTSEARTRSYRSWARRTTRARHADGYRDDARPGRGPAVVKSLGSGPPRPRRLGTGPTNS
jgi:glyoxylase-like metal-dependent hydrolase (beta-lactamase superfamily II)